MFKFFKVEIFKKVVIILVVTGLANGQISFKEAMKILIYVAPYQLLIEEIQSISSSLKNAM